MQCGLCRRAIEASGGFCGHHATAKEALEKGFVRCREAYGELLWEEYLRKVVSLQGTGLWVREVAEMALKGEASRS